jgi:hypothetical protein
MKKRWLMAMGRFNHSKIVKWEWPKSPQKPWGGTHVAFILETNITSEYGLPSLSGFIHKF